MYSKRKSNLASSQAAAEMCSCQMVRLASHGGSRHALQRPHCKKKKKVVVFFSPPKTSKSKSTHCAAHNQSYGIVDSCSEGVPVGGGQGCVTNLPVLGSINRWKCITHFLLKFVSEKYFDD